VDRIQDRHLSFEFWPFFNQSEMEMMERVMHKTLIALNIEKTAWTGCSGGGRWNRCPALL
jgi:hypothetical protein